jgi:hypothetical protein
MRAVLFAFTTTFIVSNVHAQERRAAPGGAEPLRASTAPVALPDIPYDAAHPMAGVWQGQFRPGPGESVPFTVVVEFLNGSYQVYSMINNGNNAISGQRIAVSGDTLRFENNNSGGGFLVYTGRMTGRNALSGVMTFREFEPLDEHRRNPPTFTLRRRGAA